MLGFNDISYTPGCYYQPGLGNQMYQYAALMGIASYKGYEFCAPLSSPISPSSLLLPSLCFKLEGANFNCLPSAPKYENTKFDFNRQYMEVCPDEVTLAGISFFSVKYFSHIEKEVRAAYTFKDAILAECLKIRKAITAGDAIAIQVRRGDYTASTLGVCSEHYYHGALNKLDGNRRATITNSQLGGKRAVSNKPVLVFSDDPAWCLSKFKGDRFRFIVDKDSRHSHSSMSSATQLNVETNDRVIFVEDYRYSLCLMTLCNDFIISNSTFGIWGAWLAENLNRVIRPQNLWIKPLPNDKDYYPKSNNWTPFRGW